MHQLDYFDSSFLVETYSNNRYEKSNSWAAFVTNATVK